jgi:hypothetical protein
LGEKGPELREPRPWMTGPRRPRTDVVDPNVAPLHEHSTNNSKRVMKHLRWERVKAGDGDGDGWGRWGLQR